MCNRIAWGAIGLFAAAAAFSQVPAPTEFEVASVRLNTANDRIVAINVGPRGRFAARGYTLVLLMQRAYGVMDWNVTGGPGWIRTESARSCQNSLSVPPARVSDNGSRAIRFRLAWLDLVT